MPPRVRTAPFAAAAAATLDASSLQVTRSSTTRQTCLAALAITEARRSFGTTTHRHKMTKARFEMFQWLDKVNEEFNGENGPKYIGPLQDQPFPNNPHFRSQPVLAESMKKTIYDKVVERGQAISAVSEEMGVEVKRVAAVVRLKQLEKDMVEAGKPLAIPYARAVMRMLPKTYFEEGSPNNVPHEPINDISVHSLTTQQLFVPVPESRSFTREDAAKAFHERMLSPDERSPQRELVKAERAIVQGELSRGESMARFRERAQQVEEAHAKKLAKERYLDRKNMVRVRTDRAEFRFKGINVEDVGKDGRSPNGVGWRYGAPLQDRKRGLVKIPTSVP